MRSENGPKNMAKFMGRCLILGFKNKVIFNFNRILYFLLSIFDGHLPILIISDPDMVQEIFVKQFSNFSARRVKR